MAIRKYGAALKTLGSPITLLIVYPGKFPTTCLQGSPRANAYRIDPVLGLVYDTELGLALKEYFDKYAPDYPVTTLADGVDGTLKVLHESTAEDHIKFLNHKHEERPW